MVVHPENLLVYKGAISWRIGTSELERETRT
jgi:hypothetical protein